MNKIVSFLRTDNSDSRYQMVDFFKVIAAIMVVIIHAVVTQDNDFINLIKSAITGIAVPFFFMVSGFFFKKGLDKAENQKEYLIKYIKKLGIAFAFWNILLLPSLIIGYIQLYSDKSFVYITIVILRRIFLSGNGFLWYILALIEASIVIYFLNKCKSKLPLIAIIIIGFLLFIGYDCFYAVLENTPYGIINKLFYAVFSWSCNFIMKGIPYVGVGYLFADCKNKISTYAYGIAFVIFTIINVLLCLYPMKNCNLTHLVYIFYSFTFFAVAMTTKVRIKGLNSVFFRELSSVIYFAHWTILYDIINVIFVTGLNDYIRILLVLLICTVLYILTKMSKFTFLKNVMNIK